MQIHFSFDATFVLAPLLYGQIRDKAKKVLQTVNTDSVDFISTYKCTRGLELLNKKHYCTDVS